VEEGEHYFLVKQENDRLRSELELANLNLENKIEQKTRVLNMNIRSLQRYEKIVETLPVGLLCVSDDGMVVLSNTQFCKTFGFNSAVEGMPFKRVLPSELHPTIDNFQPEQKITYKHNDQNLIVIPSPLEIEKSIFGKLLIFIVDHER
jgi:PAS domain-containing protein